MIIFVSKQGDAHDSSWEIWINKFNIFHENKWLHIKGFRNLFSENCAAHFCCVVRIMLFFKHFDPKLNEFCLKLSWTENEEMFIISWVFALYINIKLLWKDLMEEWREQTCLIRSYLRLLALVSTPSEGCNTALSWPAPADTVKPVYNDHLLGYLSAFWSSSRWPMAT